MKDSDLMIFEEEGCYTVQVRGRANFEYGVPLRELSKNLSANFRRITFEMSECTAVDSTFMGVMTMLALSAKKRGKQAFVCGITPPVKQLLKGLGVDKLFLFKDESSPECSAAAAAAVKLPAADKSSVLERAETVVDAHKTLVDIDDANAEKFEKVIEFAEKDLEDIRRNESEQAGKE